MRKRITSLLLTLVMLLSLVPALGVPASAAEEDDGVVHVSDYGDFYGYFHHDGITIILEDDLVATDPMWGDTTLYDSLWVQPFRTVTIDLNGHKLELSASTGGDTKDGIIHINNGTLTIKDSSPGQTGEIYGSFPGGGVKRMHSVIDMEGDLSRFDLEGGGPVRQSVREFDRGRCRGGRHGGRRCIRLLQLAVQGDQHGAETAL